MSQCPHCSFDPTSLSDYCDKHRPRFDKQDDELVARLRAEDVRPRCGQECKPDEYCSCALHCEAADRLTAQAQKIRDQQMVIDIQNTSDRKLVKEFQQEIAELRACVKAADAMRKEFRLMSLRADLFTDDEAESMRTYDSARTTIARGEGEC